jgi:hypothetical protein
MLYFRFGVRSSIVDLMSSSILKLAGCLEGLGKRVETLEQAVLSGEGTLTLIPTLKSQ